jgi:hypothetical protein
MAQQIITQAISRQKRMVQWLLLTTLQQQVQKVDDLLRLTTS